MGSIQVHEFTSLDGVIDAPTWTFEYGFDPRMGETIGAATARCGGILLGRTTYEMFEPASSTRTADDDPGAPFFNDSPKYVVSGTLNATTWRNSSVVGPYDAAAIRRLKEETDGDLSVGGAGLAASLLDLIDEFRPTVVPAFTGGGKPYFPLGADLRLRLVEQRTFGSGAVYLRYQWTA